MRFTVFTIVSALLLTAYGAPTPLINIQENSVSAHLSRRANVEQWQRVAALLSVSMRLLGLGAHLAHIAGFLSLMQ